MEQWLNENIWQNLQQEEEILDEDLLISSKWLEFLQMSPFLKKKLLTLLKTVSKMRAHSIIYPPEHRIMYWSYICDPSDIKVVIIGQDPYHGGQGTGLAFSVSKEYPIPPSLKNIFFELTRSDSSFSTPNHGCLDNWAKQGVLLLNTILTVEKGKAGSHSSLGWCWFTNYIISCLSEHLKSCVFLLWGSKAIEKAGLINTQQHLVLKAQHPSPLAANNTRPSNWPRFIGCNHFVEANSYLKLHGRDTIDWNLE
ncbi:uracil-DNA glycosylase [Vespertilionid gammaherpesvirus 1]|uniref:Uracil-DNA glycosylase n=1 Tax=Vespertilionid gammaherpesvirus 1 TaxID=2560830 RepID=A0A0X9XZU0_9GAMA|nr:uracil-DNA glycosylase [Myotis gammaherpesvirus 8]AMA67401.1 uracil-DNA glycosylase [Vespertilionid gammaherpesvirus 1]